MKFCQFFAARVLWKSALTAVQTHFLTQLNFNWLWFIIITVCILYDTSHDELWRWAHNQKPHFHFVSLAEVWKELDERHRWINQKIGLSYISRDGAYEWAFVCYQHYHYQIEVFQEFFLFLNFFLFQVEVSRPEPLSVGLFAENSTMATHLIQVGFGTFPKGEKVQVEPEWFLFFWWQVQGKCWIFLRSENITPFNVINCNLISCGLKSSNFIPEKVIQVPFVSSLLIPVSVAQVEYSERRNNWLNWLLTLVGLSYSIHRIV